MLREHLAATRAELAAVGLELPENAYVFSNDPMGANTNLRRDLEHALSSSPLGAPGHASLRRQLDEVIAEQDERTQIRHTREPSH